MADTTTPLYGFVQPEVGASTDTWGGKENTDLLQIEQEIARQRIPFLSPAVGPTTTLDLNQTSGARVFAFTVSQVTTIAITNPPSASFFARILLKITNGAAFAVTWPAAFDWEGGSAPTLSASGVDWVEAFTLDGGVTWYAQVVHYNALASSIVNVRRLGSPIGNTTSGVEVSIASVSIPANTVIANGDTVRITLSARPGGATGFVKLKFGSVVLETFNFGLNNELMIAEVIVTRQALNQQVALSRRQFGQSGLAVSVVPTRTTLTETETNTILVDARGAIGASQVLSIESLVVEFIKS